MDTKEITVSDLAREQIRNAERLFPLILEKTEERKEKKTIISVSGGSGVQVELAAVLVGNGPVDVDGLGTADVQIAVGLGREAGMDLADLALGQISVDDVGQKVFICHVFSPCQRHKVPIYSIILYNTPFP